MNIIGFELEENIGVFGIYIYYFKLICVRVSIVKFVDICFNDVEE